MASKPDRYEVLLTRGAEQDLESIYDYVAEYDSRGKADALLDNLIEVVNSLQRFPERGTRPRELQSLGIKEYRQTSFKPYRMIYRVVDKRVIVHLIADGRRDMQSLLSRRLLGA